MKLNKKRKKAKKKHNGIILGIKNGKCLIQPVDSGLPNRNMFIVGGPGSYKTQTLITNILYETESSIVVTDPKGGAERSTMKSSGTVLLNY